MLVHELMMVLEKANPNMQVALIDTDGGRDLCLMNPESVEIRRAIRDNDDILIAEDGQPGGKDVVVISFDYDCFTMPEV